MKKPDVGMWDREYPVKMREWVCWHVEHTDIDNLDEFMRFFMRYSKGQINPQTVKEVWKENVQPAKQRTA